MRIYFTVDKSTSDCNRFVDADCACWRGDKIFEIEWTELINNFSDATTMVSFKLHTPVHDY